jgi:hypothetical protein
MAKITDFIPIGEWLPDRQELDNEGAFIVKNAVPEGQDYKPFQGLAFTTDALDSTVLGGHAFRDKDGVINHFAGTATKLSKLASGTNWLNVSRAGNYVSQEDLPWQFANYGNRVIATNYTENMQSYIQGTSTLFSDLSVNAPRAKYITVFKDFVIVANTYDSVDGAVANRVRWCEIDNPEGWTVGTNGSDFQDVQGFGAIVGIKNMQDFVVVVMETGVVRMEYVGGTYVFSFRPVDQTIGSRSPNSIVSNGTNLYYYGENGYYMFDGLSSNPIGDNRVDKYFYDHVDSNYLYKIVGTPNPAEKYIIWHYRSVNSPDGNIDKAIIYSWASNRFSECDSACDFCFSGFTSGYTLEQLAALYGSLEAVPFSLDSSAWTGGQRVLQGFDTSHRMGSFNAQNKAVSIETGETQLNSQGRAIVYGLKPIVDTDSVTVAMGYRSRQGQAVSYTAERTKNMTTEECNFNIDARYHRAKITIPAATSWKRLKGLRVRAEATGQI